MHLYPCFDRVALLRAALARAGALGGPLCLLLCESSGHQAFRELCEGRAAGGALAVRPTSEAISLQVSEPGAAGSLYLVAGRQFVSSEGVEVLALGLEPDSPLAATADRERPASWLLERALETAALAVLPWGLLKWTGARGRLVNQLARERCFGAHPSFLLGDVAQRCWPWPEPRLLREHRVLAGSDPLPVPGAERRVARYGTRVQGSLLPHAPARSLFDALRSSTRLERFGRAETPLETLREQIMYRRIRATRPSSEAPCAATH